MLDNPAWGALNSLQSEFAEGTDRAKRYRKGVLPFIACVSEENEIPADALDKLDPLMEKGEVFYIIGRLPVLPKHWTLEFELPCAQMVLPEGAAGVADSDTAAKGGQAGTGPTVELLDATHAMEMYELVSRVQPGYYTLDTRLLGNYYGIRQEGKLVAMAGERMRLTGFCELSAIVTDPGYTGKGYAQKLITHICGIHFREGIRSMLHVALTNERAIRLYEHMGFRHRREISFWRCRKE